MANTGPVVKNLRYERLGRAIYIGRAVPRRRMDGSIYANPFKIGPDGSRGEVLARYRQHLRDNPELVERARRELPGMDLACWCHPKPCHGHILVAVVMGEEP